MATSGSKVVKVTAWDNLVFTWSISSQSIANNTSTVAWALELRAGSSGRIDSSEKKSWSVVVNGTGYSGFDYINIDNNSTKTLASGTTVIKHDEDGTKDFSYKFYQMFQISFSGGWIGEIEASGTGTLDTIPRASQPSCITWPGHTQNVGYFGDTISIHMNRKSAEFTHRVRYQFGSQSGTIATDVGTGTTWTIPVTLMNLIPNNTSGSGTIYVDTYIGNVILGTKYCGFTAEVPDSVNPTCTIAVSDPTGNYNTYGAYVKGLSKFSVTITPTLAYSSPIKSYEGYANGVYQNTASYTTSVLKSSGSQKVSVNITDGRNRVYSTSQTFNVLDYSAPSVTKLTVGRCDSDGTANMTGDYVQATFSATVTSLSSKNTATYKIRYKKTTATTFTEVTISKLANNYTVTNEGYIFAADGGSSYDVEVSVTDSHSTATRTTSASTAFAIMHFRADGTGLGLLKVAEKQNAIDVGGDIFLNGHAMYGSHGMIDTRETNETPEWYMQNHAGGTVWEFKKLTAIQFTAPSTTFAPVQTIIPWMDSSGGYPRQVAYEGTTRWTRIGTSNTTWGAWRSDALSIYPVGSVYIAFHGTDPATLFGGTWERIKSAFLWGCGDGEVVGATGGAKEHTLTTDQIPKHAHGATYSSGVPSDSKNKAWLSTTSGTNIGFDYVYAGGGKAHNNMPPYVTVMIWRRTA